MSLEPPAPCAALPSAVRLRRRLFGLVNVVGGTAVLCSYALWLGNPAHDGAALWGALGGVARRLYTTSMLSAAAGYFVLFEHVLRREIPRLSPDAFAILLTIFVLMLFPSALWMPLAFEFLAAPAASVWWAMRATLFVVAAASVALIGFVLGLDSESWSPPRRWAVVGACAFAVQTAVLDPFVWPLCFPA